MSKKNKYLYVKIDKGFLYIYADNKKWEGSKKVTLLDMNTDCEMGRAKDKHIRIPIKTL